MSEKEPSSPERRRMTRRRLLGGMLGFTALTAAGGIAAYSPTTEAYSKFRSMGHDYSNYPFLEATGAQPIDQERLDELLAGPEDKTLRAHRVSRERQTDPENLAEFTFMLDEPGPVYVRFDGLEASSVSLTILEARVDNNETFYVPIVRGPNKEAPSEIQLGQFSDGEPHHLAFSLAPGSALVGPDEIEPQFTWGQPDTIRDLIDRHQPDIFLRDYENITNNIPLRSAVFVHETADTLALIYWTECLGEDPEYRFLGKFIGTRPETLVENKNRTVDWDWVLEAHVDKASGKLLEANIAEPYHNRRPVVPDSSYDGHLPLRIASNNNNVATAASNSTLGLAKFRPRPQVHTHADRKVVLYGTSKDTATLSLLQHIQKGNINLKDTRVENYFTTLGLDISDFRD